jgi:hypothetical protein
MSNPGVSLRPDQLLPLYKAMNEKEQLNNWEKGWRRRGRRKKAAGRNLTDKYIGKKMNFITLKAVKNEFKS